MALRWGGNQQAQAEADAAFAKLKDKKKNRKGKPVRVSGKKKRHRNRKPWKNADGSVNYHAYIVSRDWQRKREGVLQRRGRKCEQCGNLNQIQVHHRHYRTLGKESDGDLQILCHGCHSNHHEGKNGIVMDPMTAEFVGMFRV
jgi:5-methylcytosine-specific restriction endonuclease McrA